MPDFEISDPGEVKELIDHINKYSGEYDDLTQQRHNEGERKYGAGSWLGIDTLQHAIDEVLDLGNYARFTYIKLRMLQDKVAAFQADGSTKHEQESYNGPLGKNAKLLKGMPQ
jgi:hypothetical protein